MTVAQSAVSVEPVDGTVQGHADGIMKLTLPQGSRNLRETPCIARSTTMAAKQNITLAIDGALLKRARAVAARRGLSVSALLAAELRALLAEEAAYESARRRAVVLLQDGLPLGGVKIDDRESLHERRRVR
jgi:2-hydroxychromene-2-carboxylate isomerase